MTSRGDRAFSNTSMLTNGRVATSKNTLQDIKELINILDCLVHVDLVIANASGLTCASICFWWTSACHPGELRALRGVFGRRAPNLTSDSPSGTEGWETEEDKQEANLYTRAVSNPQRYAFVCIFLRANLRLGRCTTASMITQICMEKLFTFKLKGCRPAVHAGQFSPV